jgi:hypothetical protein
MAGQSNAPPDLQALRRELATLRTKLADAGTTREGDEAALAALGRDLETLRADLHRKVEESWTTVRPAGEDALG